jgi:hypothetical protein
MLRERTVISKNSPLDGFITVMPTIISQGLRGWLRCHDELVQTRGYLPDYRHSDTLLI